MVDSEPILVLDPPRELHFQAPFNQVVASYLKLTNPTDQHIYFKVKTTAPKKYCVRPNEGIIPPKKTTTVSFLLEPVDFEIAKNFKHKFLIKFIYVRDGEVSLNSLWNETAPEKYSSAFLVSVFDPPSIEPEEHQKKLKQKILAAVSEILESNGTSSAVTLKSNKTLSIADEYTLTNDILFS